MEQGEVVLEFQTRDDMCLNYRLVSIYELVPVVDVHRNFELRMMTDVTAIDMHIDTHSMPFVTLTRLDPATGQEAVSTWLLSGVRTREAA